MLPSPPTTVSIVSMLLVALTAAPTSARSAVEDEHAELNETFTRVIHRTGGEDFWGAVLVARDGDVIYSRGFGMADLEAVPNADDTIFDVASVSKQYTAAAVLRLQQAGLLHVEDRVVMHIDSALQQVPVDKIKLRLHHLLDQTSGLPVEIDFQPGELHDRTAFIRRVMATPNVAPPGERFEYNNVNYFLLAAIIEIVSGKPFEQYMRDDVFAPAGLKHTTFVHDDAIPQRLRSTRVMNGRRMSVIDYGWSWGFRGAACVLSSTRETWQWLNALENEAFLKRELLQQMITPNRFGYALGWYVNRTPAGSRRVFHTGSTGGYRTCVIWRPDEDGAVILYSNEACDPVTVAEAVERAAFPSGAAPCEIGLYLNPYELTDEGELVVEEALQWMVRPQYIASSEDGIQLRDDRIAAFLLDQSQMFSPVLLKLNDDAAVALAGSIESSIPEEGELGAGSKLELRITIDPASLDEHGAFIVEGAPLINVVRDGAHVVLSIGNADGQRLATITLSSRRARELLGRFHQALEQRGVDVPQQ